jgi:hypothetical protein
MSRGYTVSTYLTSSEIGSFEAAAKANGLNVNQALKLAVNQWVKAVEEKKEKKEK